MRLFVLCCLFSLAGCVGSARIEGFAANGPAAFLYSAQTNTVMTANDDGTAERLRRDWIADALHAHAMCSAGYVADTRHYVPNVAGPFGNGGETPYAAEPHPGVAAGDAEHLVGGAVIMMVAVDAVAPGIRPAVLGKHPLAGAGAVAARGQRLAIDDERQCRIVRHDAVIGEAIGLDCRCSHCLGHGNDPYSLPSLSVRPATT